MYKWLKHLSALTFLCIVGVSESKVFAGTIWVGKSHAVKSIQRAIHLASPGDTVMVEYGNYGEGNITIAKSLVLKGINFPVLDGRKKYEVVSIKASHVTIEGFRIKSSGHSSLQDIAGIKVYNEHHVNVVNNILEDNFFGIYLQQAQNCIIRKNKLTAYGKEEFLVGNGIHSWKSDSIQIDENQITGHRDGIYLEFTTNTAVDRNISHKNLRYGLHFMFAHHNSYTSNTFSSNGAGVAVMYTHHVYMAKNIFKDNWGDSAYGILLKEITDSKIEDNTFSGNTIAIFMEGAARILVRQNQFSANGWALKIQASCTDNTIEQNNFEGNTFDVATNGSLVLNTFNGNYWDKYEGYDINKDRRGDIPYHPISLYSMIVEKYPPAMLLFRSFMVTILDRTEKMIPGITPEGLKDKNPVMKPLKL